MAQLSPFPVDAAVMAAIRAMRGGDACAVAALHHTAMGNSLWARLGIPFLTRLYEGLVRHPAFLGYVYIEDGAVRGFIAGTTDSARLFRQVLLREAAHLFIPALLGVLRNPSILLPLLATPLYFGRSDVDVAAESMFCSFEPHLRGKRLAGHVNKVLFEELVRRGHRLVKVTTEIDNAAAIRQLESWGFERRAEFSFYGKPMVAFVLDMSTCPRISARFQDTSIS